LINAAFLSVYIIIVSNGPVRNMSTNLELIYWIEKRKNEFHWYVEALSRCSIENKCLGFR